MNKYKNAHLWLLIPFIIVMVGFSRSYWSVFTDAPWRHHLHGLTATLWFVLLIAQPYLITRGHAKKHRLFGMIGLVLAGGVAFSGLGLIPYNLANERLPDVAKYGLSFVDIVLVPGFLFAVVMAIINSKRADDHAKWMTRTISTVLIAAGCLGLSVASYSVAPSDKEKILEIRAQSNAAIRNHDAEIIVSSFDDPYQITTGSGRLFHDSPAIEKELWEGIFEAYPDVLYCSGEGC